MTTNNIIYYEQNRTEAGVIQDHLGHRQRPAWQRGRMGFKQYILGFLFYRFISENLTEYINRLEEEASGEPFDYAAMPDEDAEYGREETVRDVIHAGQYKTRPNSVITRYGDRFEYASPEETPSLMADLVDWYNKAEQEGKLTPIELAVLFHYRYIRIRPFEDGNGRIARLMVNFILTRHDYPMIVVRSRKKSEYLEALHQADLEVGPVPSDGAHADIKDIRPFLKYFNDLVATEVYNDVLFVSEKNENVWWYDGERIAFRTPNYTKILNAMRTYPSRYEGGDGY